MVFVLMAMTMIAMRNLSAEEVLRVESCNDKLCSDERRVNCEWAERVVSGATIDRVAAGSTEPRVEATGSTEPCVVAAGSTEPCVMAGSTEPCQSVVAGSTEPSENENENKNKSESESERESESENKSESERSESESESESKGEVENKKENENEKEENAHLRPTEWKSKMCIAGAAGVAAASYEVLLVAAEVQPKKSAECGSETVCLEALLERRGNEKSAKCGSETVCLEALLERRGDEKSAKCGSVTVCPEALLQRRDDNGKKMAVFGNGCIKCVNDYEWYDSDSGDIGIELGECEQGGVLEFKICARNSYETKGSSDVIQL